MTQEKQTAFTQAYARCQKRFERYCVALAYGKMDAQDLIQDVLLSTYERFEQIKHKDQLLHYMIRTARNRSISQWRRARFQTQLREKHTRELFAQGINPEMAVDVQLLYSKMEALPDKQRDALILFDICGFSLKEVADIQQGQVNTVKSHLRRGRKKLQLLMEDKPRKRWLVGLLVTPQIPKVGFGSFKQFIVQLNPIPMYSFIAILLAGSITLLVSLNQTQSQSLSPLLPTKPVQPIATQLWQSQTLTTKVLKPQQKLVKPWQKITLDLLLPMKTQLAAKPKKPGLSITKYSQEKASSVQPVSADISLAPINSLLTLAQPPLLTTLLAPQQETGTCDSSKFVGSVKKFRKMMLRNLKRDRLIDSKKDDHRIQFNGRNVLVNKRPVPKGLQAKYMRFFLHHGISPCERRLIIVGANYVGIGEQVNGKFHGILRLDKNIEIKNAQY